MKAEFKVHGLDCAEEVAVLKREVGPVVRGADRLAFDILNARMIVDCGDAEIPTETILQAVARTGMRAEPYRQSQTVRRASFWEQWARTLLTAVSGLFTLAGFIVHVLSAGGLLAALGSESTGVEHDVPLAARILYGVAILSGVWQVLPKAWLAAGRMRPDMNLLMIVAVAGAVGIGEWLEGATVAFLFALSLSLEAWSVGRARRAVEALLDLAPKSVRLHKTDGSEELVPPDEVRVGSLFVVRPGERLPLDGQVVRGSSHVNQAPITGESAPVAKGPGDVVFAGTINGEGALDIESTKPAGDTTLAHIIRLVGEAQSKRAPAEQWVERFAQIYTPVVMLLAITLALVPPLVGGEWAEWFYRSLVLLVIACPCALVISTPVSIVAALASAARHGVLIKGGLHVETPARLRAIAFDKTGTLTEGRPIVVEVIPFDEHNERDLLERAASLEARSEHPLGVAITSHARAQGIPLRSAEDFRMIAGKGATGRLGGTMYWLGSHRYLEERGQETKEVHEKLEQLAGAGRTVVVIGNDRHVCGLIVLADAVRANATDGLRSLRAAGIEHLILLTGDNRPTAEAVARATGIDEVRAELLPADKVRAVEELVAKYGSVAMVGDGVNDAPALARASLGVAMGAVGTDVAIETADVALMSDDLTRLPWLIKHSRKTLRIIRQNIVLSLLIKALFVVLTLAGHSSLWAAIAADTGASLLVIFNGLRLLRE